jgi:NADPH:quinone reductase
VDTLKLDTAEASAILRELAPAFESGALRPPQVKATFPLEDAKAAYAAVKTGKVVLLPTKEPGRS